MSNTASFLAGCTTMAAALAAFVALAGAKTPATAHFDTITVGRINVEEPDGTKRLVISNRTQFPGLFYRGQEVSRPDRRSSAGLLFVNDEGTESGGLIWGGAETGDGKLSSSLHLSFDRFRQDQTLALEQNDDEHSSRAGVTVNDMPDWRVSSIEDLQAFSAQASKLSLSEREAYLRRKQDDGMIGHHRVYLGTTEDRSSTLQLRDGQGRVRMQLLVTVEGTPEIRMLDEGGRVVKTVTSDGR
jgi:hypothetical protein